MVGLGADEYPCSNELLMLYQKKHEQIVFYSSLHHAFTGYQKKGILVFPTLIHLIDSKLCKSSSKTESCLEHKVSFFGLTPIIPLLHGNITISCASSIILTKCNVKKKNLSFVFLATEKSRNKQELILPCAKSVRNCTF